MAENVPTQHRELELRQTVAPGMGVILAAFAPVTGKITAITRHWPPGCGSPAGCLMLIAIHLGGMQMLPQVGFAAMDSATPTVPMNQPVRSGQRIWVELQNLDAVNPHTVSVLIEIEGIFKPLPRGEAD